MSTIIYRPLFLDQNSGFPTGVPDNAILNIAGVAGPVFTVGGKELLFTDGTTSGGGTAPIISLQASYNNSVPATINLVSGKDLIIDVPNSEGVSFKIDGTTGAVTIGGDFYVGGTSTIINSTIYESDHIHLTAISPSVPALWIGPDEGQVAPSTDLINVSIIPGDTSGSTFKIDAGGNATFGSTLTVIGLINGVDLFALKTAFDNHIYVNGTYKHLAREINIDPETFNDLPSGVVKSVQSVLEFLDTSINSIDAQVQGLHSDVDNLQDQIDGIVQQDVGEANGYTFVVDVPSTEWVIQHNKNSRNFIFMMFDDNGFMFQPDTAQIVDANTVIVTFGAQTTGRVNMIFYKDNQAV